jgi:hypothetical protein
MSARPARWVVAALAAAALLPSSGRAESLYLYSSGAQVTANGARFHQTNIQPTGTGVIDPFLTIQRTGSEQGYNTDGTFQFDEKRTSYTNALPLNSLQAVTINGVAYYQFLLDINEKGTDTGRKLSLNEVQLYLGNTDSPTANKTWGGDFNGFKTPSTLVYDLDGAGNKTIELDYKLGHGSGSGDMFMYVPKSSFDSAAASTGYEFVYLYSKFGSPNGSDAGFEEWAALKKPSGGGGGSNNPVPAPPGLVLAGMGFGCLLLRRLRTGRPVAPRA